jgi:phosphohistidine phosphatase
MKLYLVQHANAVSKDEDPDRPLSEQGRADLAKVADFVHPLKIEVDYLWHSKKSRAVQTAEILSEVVKTRKSINERDDINPNDEITALVKDLSKIDGDVMVVGHMPFLGRLASELLSGSENANTVRFRQGGIVCLNYDKDTGWQIEWMITPDVLPQS